MIFIASALLKDHFREIDPILMVSNIQAKTKNKKKKKKISLQVDLTWYSQE